MNETAQKKIVVADDSRTISMMLTSVLSQAGYHVVTAFDGLEALEKVYQNAPDLVVLDILMPRMNGYQVCRLLKDDPQTSDIPIIMLSAKSEQKDKFWGLQTGADRYLTKSNNIASVLLEDIDAFFSNQDSGSKNRPLTLPNFNHEELIQRLNHLLDDLLFHSVLINEIQNRSQDISDFTILNRELLLLLSQVVQFQLGALYFVEDDSGTLVIYLPSTPLSAEHITENLIANIKAKLPSLPLPHDLYNFSFNVTPEPPNRLEPPPPVSDSLVEEIRIRGQLQGLLLLQRYDGLSFSEEEEKTLQFYFKHATALLDNALLYRKTQQLAITDGLTKLYNHRYFQDCLKDELVRAKRFRRPLSLIIIDIDHFKHFNDTYGHQQGDNVLKEIAHLLQKNVRSIETVSRYGGEEFTIILPETDLEEGREIAERLRSKVENNEFSITKVNAQEKITISLGVSSFPSAAENQVDLIRNADQALYRAKDSGRNQAVVAPLLGEESPGHDQ